MALVTHHTFDKEWNHSSGVFDLLLPSDTLAPEGLNFLFSPPVIGFSYRSPDITIFKSLFLTEDFGLAASVIKYQL